MDPEQVMLRESLRDFQKSFIGWWLIGQTAAASIAFRWKVKGAERRRTFHFST